MANIILTSSFNTVARELYEKNILPRSVRVAFIVTAGNIYESVPWIDADRKALEGLGYDVFDVDLQGSAAEKLRTELQPAQIIFVAGGNTTYLTHWAHESGFGTVVRQLLMDGRTYVGSSAGSILAGPSVAPFLEEEIPDLPDGFMIGDARCLGLVDYIVLPHQADSTEELMRMEHAFGDQFTFIPLTDRDYKVATLQAVA